LSNLDKNVIEGFGDEWDAYDQVALSDDERKLMFDDYFHIFPFEKLPADAVGFDLGCGSGRWAMLVAPRVHKLHCIDPAEKALAVAKNALSNHKNVQFHLATTETIGLQDASQDFGYSLGVLHHIPDTEKALADAVRKLKPGAPMLVYLYYKFDNRAPWFKFLWQVSEIGRSLISRSPFALKRVFTEVIAFGVYLPLSRAARLGAVFGLNVSSWPLSWYKDKSYFSLRTDSHDRFATRLENRFTRVEIETMMQSCGLTNIKFSETQPHWVAVGYKNLD
jgi:ubiquinone/menaquinone biosynthesis C-methylase UbiE